MTRDDLMWLAGLLEGEGCFSFGDSVRRSQPRIRLVMTDRDVVEKAARLMEAGVAVRPDRRGGNRQTCYVALKTGRPAIEVMRLLLPLMGQRRTFAISEIIRQWTPRGLGRPRTIPMVEVT